MIALHSLQEPCGSGYSIDRNHNQGLPIILSSIKIEWTGNFGAPNRVSQYRSLLLPRTATSTLVDPYRGMLEIETILFWDSIIGRYKNAPVFARTRQSREFVPPLPPAYSSPLRGPSAGNGLHLFRRCVRSMSFPNPPGHAVLPVPLRAFASSRSLLGCAIASTMVTLSIFEDSTQASKEP
ncbi:hypothetical protein BD410DRAFT_842488 [Rickenella mellea]|uniref:Uncharacterized protein n=1 Tax=Rickenella mellea TaxID=50990 RepID=A0A4Y7PWE2_9AGAM|nr:hypothetical protein BD410DRAFT_842488 [Rickenella mellea]